MSATFQHNTHTEIPLVRNPVDEEKSEWAFENGEKRTHADHSSKSDII